MKDAVDGAQDDAEEVKDAKAKAKAKPKAKAKGKDAKTKASPKKKAKTGKTQKKGGNVTDGVEPLPVPETKKAMKAEIRAYCEQLGSLDESEIREAVRANLPTLKKSAMNNIYWARPAVGLTCLQSGTDYAYIRFPENAEVDKQRMLLVCVKCAEILVARLF